MLKVKGNFLHPPGGSYGGRIRILPVKYAPALSLEGMQAEYNKLYQSAFYDPDAFSAYASPNQVTWIS